MRPVGSGSCLRNRDLPTKAGWRSPKPHILIGDSTDPVPLSALALERIMQAADLLFKEGTLSPTAQRKILSPAARLRGPVGAASMRARQGPAGDPKYWNFWAEMYSKIAELFSAVPIKILTSAQGLSRVDRLDLPYAIKTSQIRTVLA